MGEIEMGIEKNVPRKTINKNNKLKIVFDESARKDFLTGFRKRKDERRKLWKEKIDRQLKNEIRKIKDETKAKLEKGMSKANSSHHIVPEVAHLINSDVAETSVTEIGSSSVSITTLDNLESVAAPWREELKKAEESEDEDQEEDKDVSEDEELPGMSLKPSTAKVATDLLSLKEKKSLNKAAVSKLHNSKAYKDKERIKAKKQRNAARFKRGKKSMSKRDKYAKKSQHNK